jgi:hypothetical protein
MNISVKLIDNINVIKLTRGGGSPYPTLGGIAYKWGILPLEFKESGCPNPYVPADSNVAISTTQHIPGSISSPKELTITYTGPVTVDTLLMIVASAINIHRCRVEEFGESLMPSLTVRLTQWVDSKVSILESLSKHLDLPIDVKYEQAYIHVPLAIKV